MHDETESNVSEMTHDLNDCVRYMRMATRSDSLAMVLITMTLLSGFYNATFEATAMWSITTSLALAAVVCKQFTTSMLNKVVSLQNDTSAQLLAMLIEKDKG